MKKTAVLLVLFIIFQCFLPVYAAETHLSEEEYLSQVAEIIKGYHANPQAAEIALQELDTELLSEPTVVNCSGVSRTTLPSNYEFFVSAFKRSNSDRYYLQWVLNVNAIERLPGPLDCISLEWDTLYGSYYSSSAGGTGCTVKGRSTGIVLFNVEDETIGTGDYLYGTVQIEPLTTGWMEFGSKFVHTYTTINVSGSANFSYSPSVQVFLSGSGSLNLAHTMGFVVNVGTSTNSWEMWTDNAVNIT